MRKRILAGVLILCTVTQVTVSNVTLRAQTNELVEQILEQTYEDALNSNITIEEAAKNIDRKDKRDDDGDGLANYWEESIGTDKDSTDTDGDNLSDYQEVVLAGTDPLLLDTDENKITDADEDLDGDGLTNREEVELGIDPLSVDTDGDGLTDWEEINVYNTEPTLYDSDADGASDGFEVKKMQEGVAGFDPLVANKTMKQLLAEFTPDEELPIVQNETDEDEIKDSDGDGIVDSEDSAPFERGLEGGIVGSLQIVGSHNPDALFSEGHSFLVYTSYVDGQEVKINNLYGSHRFNKEEYAKKVDENDTLLSWRSLVNERTAENDTVRKSIADAMWPYQTTKTDSYILNKGEYVSIGNFTQNSYGKSLLDGFVYGQSGNMVEIVALQALFEAVTGKKVDIMYVMTHLRNVLKTLASKSYIEQKDIINGTTDGGLWINREMYDQRYQYDQYPHEIYKVDITQNEFCNMMQSLNGNNYYSMLNHNCSSVASKVWNETVGYKTDANGYYLTDSTGKRKKTDLFITARGKGVLSILDFPGAVCESIVKLKNSGTSRGKYYSDNSQIVKGSVFYSTGKDEHQSAMQGGSNQPGLVVDKLEKNELEDATKDSSTREAGNSVSENTSSGIENNITKNTSMGTGTSSSLTGNSSTGESSSGTPNKAKKEDEGLLNGVFGFFGSIFSFVFNW